MSKVSAIVILLVSFVAAGSALKCYQCRYSRFHLIQYPFNQTSNQRKTPNYNRTECLNSPPPKEFLLECPEDGGHTTCQYHTAQVNAGHTEFIKNTTIIVVHMQCGHSATTDGIDECPDVEPAPRDDTIFVHTCKCHVDGCYFGPNGEFPVYTTPIPGGPTPSPGGPNPPPIPCRINKRKPKRNRGQDGQKSTPLTIYILLVIVSSAFLSI